jgi:hypothetical protein
MSVGRVSFFLVVMGFVFVHAEVSFAQNETAPQPATTQQQPLSKTQEERVAKLEVCALNFQMTNP